MTEQEAPSFAIEKLYVKDLSLEVPNAPGIFLEQQGPEVTIQLQTVIGSLGEDAYEVTLTVTATAKIGEKVYVPLFAMASLGTIIWLCIAYHAASAGPANTVLFDAGSGFRGLGDSHHLQAGSLRFRPAFAAFIEPDHHVAARIAQVQRVRVPLAAVADDGDCAPVQVFQTSVFFVESSRHYVCSRSCQRSAISDQLKRPRRVPGV